jgi:hypothetical protein
LSEGKTDQFLTRELPHLPPSSAGAPFNFVNEVLEFLCRWCSTYPGTIQLGAPAYCCFIGVERVASEVPLDPAFLECPLFREDTPQDLLDQVYISAFPLSRVFARKARFQKNHDCVALIGELGMQARPIVIFNAANRSVLWRIEGDEFHQTTLALSQAPKLLSKDFDRTLKDFHIEYTATPQGLTKPWLSVRQLLTKHELEEEIRDDLYIYLRFKMQDQFAVLREFYASTGRTDLLVCFHEEKQTLYVELKVLRSFQKSGANRTAVSETEILDWGKKGIAQAYSYRLASQGVGVSYACCFDARGKDEEIQALVDFAKQMNVQYRRFFIHTSAESLHRSFMS